MCYEGGKHTTMHVKPKRITKTYISKINVVPISIVHYIICTDFRWPICLNDLYIHVYMLIIFFHHVRFKSNIACFLKLWSYELKISRHINRLILIALICLYLLLSLNMLISDSCFWLVTIQVMFLSLSILLFWSVVIFDRFYYFMTVDYEWFMTQIG